MVNKIDIRKTKKKLFKVKKSGWKKRPFKATKIHKTWNLISKFLLKKWEISKKWELKKNKNNYTKAKLRIKKNNIDR